MGKKINYITSKAVEKKTGKSWDEWVKFLDKLGAKNKGHKEIVKLVETKGKVESPWWQQTVTVGYEYAKGKRVKGQTKDAGFQVGVQKMIPVPKVKVWKFINSKEGKRIWQGNAEIKLRTTKKGEKLRMSYTPKERNKPTVLQITLVYPRNSKKKTNVRFHHEKLKDSKEREKMRKHWKKVLKEIKEVLTNV